ncbi:MAG: PEP/pyruvate-binding domain-containing protein, partial [Adlercreutzia equolifaciens]
SWNNPRAVLYRQKEKIADDLGTAVNVQSMVFGNKGDTSATGVAFTRNPANGEREFYGDYLVNAQGEDVVAGIRNTSPIADLKTVEGLEEAGAQLEEIFDVLENHFRDMCDIEFTIEQGAVDAADPRRQAHRRGRSAHRHRDGEGRPHHQGGGHHARGPRPARPAAAPAVRQERHLRRGGPRPERESGRRGGRGRLLRRRRRGRRRGRPQVRWCAGRPTPTTWPA